MATHRRIVLATGVFDLLHVGHVRFLQESKKRGGPRARLFVVVARDKTVLSLKGHQPIFPEDQRRDLVASLRVVDKVILGRNQFDMLGILRELRPDFVAVGYDQNEIKKSVERLVRREGLKIRVVQISKLGDRALNNSTKIKARIARRLARTGRSRTKHVR